MLVASFLVSGIMTLIYAMNGIIGTLRKLDGNDDSGQNHLVKTSYCKESLSSIIHRTKSIQLKKEQCMASRF